VTIDILAWTMGKSEDEVVDAVLDDIEEVLEDISADPPDGTTIGEIMIRKMDRAMARQNMGRRQPPAD
jgi:hypothetical protein